MFTRIVKVAMASKDAMNNAVKYGPIDARVREDLRVREASGMPTHPAQKTQIVAPAVDTTKPNTTPATAAPQQDVRTLDQAKRPYPPPAKAPSVESFLEAILKKLGIS